MSKKPVAKEEPEAPPKFYALHYLYPCPPGVHGYEPRVEYYPTGMEAVERGRSLMETGAKALFIREQGH